MDGDRWIDKRSDRGRQGSPWTKMSFKLNLFWISFVRIVHQVTKQSTDSRSHLSHPWCLSMVDQQELCQFRKPPRSVDRRTHPFSFSLDILLIRLIRSPLFLPVFFMFFPLVLAISPYKNPIPKPSPGHPQAIDLAASKSLPMKPSLEKAAITQASPVTFLDFSARWSHRKSHNVAICGYCDYWTLMWGRGHVYFVWPLNKSGGLTYQFLVSSTGQGTGELPGRPPWALRHPNFAGPDFSAADSFMNLRTVGRKLGVTSATEATVMPTNSQRDGGLWDTNQDVSQHDLLLATSLGKDQKFWPMNSTCAVVKILNKALWNQGAVIQIPAKSPWLRRNCSNCVGLD